MALSDDHIRRSRVGRIRPFLKDLNAGREPKANKAVQLGLIQDLKDEGNQLFKDAQYPQACLHYKHAIFVAGVLEERFYHEVEDEFMATLFSNGSLGYLRMNNFSEALRYSEKALLLQPGNVKAKYRKVQALFSLQLYREALAEAQDGMKIQPMIFKDFVSKSEEALQAHKTRSSNSKPASASVAEQTYSAQSPDTSNEWLAGTNALQTEKRRQKVVEKMPKKKKSSEHPNQQAVKATVGDGLCASKSPQSVPRQTKDSSDSEVDSDSSNLSEDNQFASNYARVQQTRQASGHQASREGNNFAHATSPTYNSNVDALYGKMGFTKVGSTATRGRSNGMGLDDFATGQRQARPKAQPQNTSGSHLPPVNIIWPLEDTYQFRLACKMCFVKTGEGYRGYNLRASLAHACEKNVLIIRRKDNQSLNWIKIRPFPALFSHRFFEFKLCHQFANALPCKIGEPNCTFAHNFNERNLWNMERDGNFSHMKFLEELRRNGIDNSEQLAARQSHGPAEPNQIPGLNYKWGSRQRLSSPAPLAEPSRGPPPVGRPPPQPAPAPRMPMPPPPLVTPAAAPFIRPAAPRPHVTAEGMPRGVGFPPNPSNRPPPQQQFRFSSGPSTAHQPKASPGPSHGSMNNAFSNYEYKIVCPDCFLFENFPGKYRYNPCTHECEENVLMVKPKNSPRAQWVRVRERTNHRDFPGKYVVCNSVLQGRKDLCRYGEMRCSFAHNEAEQRLWALEKSGQISISDFILQNRKTSQSRGFTLRELLKKYGGYFTNVCRDCFFGRPPRDGVSAHWQAIQATPHHSGPSQEGDSRLMPQSPRTIPMHWRGREVHVSTAQHIWARSHVLAHVNPATGELIIIDQRKFKHKGAFFRICKFLHFCNDLQVDKCLSAHSMLERDVWMLERDTDISRQEIVQQSEAISHASPPRQQQPPPPPPQQSAWNGARPKSGPTNTQQSQGRMPSPAPGTDSGLPSREKVPHPVQECCGMCWINGTRSLQDGSYDRCKKGHSNFKLKRVYLFISIHQELRNLPGVIPRNLNFTLCRYTQAKQRCQFAGPGPCQFSHSNEERTMWIWMARNKVGKLEDVVKACNEDAKRAKINQGDSVVTAKTVSPGARIRVPGQLQNNAHYCRYCSVQSNSERQWEEHCASEKHIFNVNSDKDHQWNFRQPPWGQGNNLDICSKHINGGRCQYSSAPDMFNFCKYAHSQEELDEWRERYEWRKMKRTMAKEQNMFSYMDSLLEQYNTADSRVTEMSETLAGVEVVCKQPLEVFRQEKNAVVEWAFHIQTQLPLEKVALLHHTARLHFTLRSTDGTKHQITSGEQFEDVDEQGKPCYRISVHFTGGMFGSFNQWVAFDFGRKPVLMRKLNVELGQTTEHEKVKDLRQKLAFDRWTKENRQVIPNHYTYDEVELDLLQRYKEPTSELVVTQDSIKELNQHNYVHKMHKMLHLEEITRHKLISSFNMVSNAEVLDVFTSELHGTSFCRNGELFLRLPLTDNLTEDTGAGKLILTSVKSAYLTRKDLSDKHRVYEAFILDEGRGKDFVIVRLTPVCVRELSLRPQMKVEMEVQFQMDRLHFIRMHFALDQLTSTDIVFPDIMKINPLLNEQHTLSVSSRNLNSDQMLAVKHIVAERTGYSPPFIMFGPFGTGKTETLAQATMVLLKERPTARILICTQSNSAADLYVTRYLDSYLSRKSQEKSLLLRIIARERRLTSVPKSVRKYCFLSADGSAFEIPDRDVVVQHKIVVTTVEMSLSLTTMGLKGVFTHIFIDEAAQALECETIMPLTLATDKTCVVLTGDHLQISPKVYSAEARRQNFGMSMLERLHQHYFQFYHQLQQIPHSTPLTNFLSINYRTKREILRFISAVFYGGPEKLTAKGVIPSVVELTPLLFYAVQGKEVQDFDSTSFYNQAEGNEVVEGVQQLVENWPQEWGEVTPEEISVVTPYHSQVKIIRRLLKQKRAGLDKVNVETVQNIQGKEFRALFISTVRTRNLLESEHVAKALKEAEAVGGVTDFGFLSDHKLLNTALTRTKSLVAVVGDPVALCAIGECIQIWRTYLKHCQNMRSIYPPSMNYDNIKTQVIHLQLSPMGRRLAEVTALCKNPNPPLSTAPRPSPDNSNLTGYKTHSELHADQDPAAHKMTEDHPDLEALSAPGSTKHPVPSAPKPLQSSSKVKVTKAMSSQDKVTDISVTADEILLQMASESMSDGDQTEPLKVECVAVVEEGGQAIVTYKPDLVNADKRKKMQQAAAAGQEFYCDEEIYQDLDKDTGADNKYFNYTDDTLQGLLLNHPDQFKRCVLHIDTDHCMAKVLNPQDPVQEVEVKGCLNRGQAFDKDEVVVQILKARDGEDVVSGKPQGQVVGIKQRAVDHRCRSIVCAANTSNMGLLNPINPGMPCIYNVLLQKHVQRVKKGFVCVYQLSADNKLTFSHYEKVEANDVQGKLFVVRYLKWLPGFFNPLGVVVGVIPAGHDLTSALDILAIEHHLPAQFSESAVLEVQSCYGEDYVLSADVSSTHSDMTSAWCFTIDCPYSSSTQVAFSIDQVSDVSYQVCVHISDVAYFVKQDSALDREAFQRGTTIQPIGSDPVCILPSRLSSELCSLQTGKDRFAVSVFMTVTGSGEEWHVVQTSVQQTVINCKQHFSYDDVEATLNDIQGAESDYIKSCIIVLYQIAHMQRKQRKGNAHLDPELDPSEMAAPRAHHMVQELLVMANYQIAEQLLKAFPHCTPLLQQASPNEQKVEEWKSKHAADAINSVALTRPFLSGSQVCTCGLVCMCVFRYMKDQETKPLEHFDVVTELWNQALAAAQYGQTDLVQKLVATPNNHPQSNVALKELHSIVPPQQFICFGDTEPSQQGHYSLNLPHFTTMTNPLHSYISIVVQRLMTALITGQQCPYSQADISHIVTACNHSQQRADSYTSANTMVHLAASLQSRPLMLFPVVEKLDGRNLHLHFPDFSFVPERECSIAITSLNSSTAPKVMSDKGQVVLTWQERIYDSAPLEDAQQSRGGRKTVELCADRFVSQVPPFQWQKLLTAVREENAEKLQKTVPEVQEHIRDSFSEGRFAWDVTSEVNQGDLIQHFSEFSLSLHTCMVVQVQVAAELTNGLLSPRLQLFSLSSRLDVCLEHRSNPAQCFTKVISPSPITTTYLDESSFQKSWLPVLSLEAAETAVHSQSSVILHNISIKWSHEPVAGEKGDELAVIGKFSLQQSFFKDRQISLFGDSHSQDDLGVFGLERSVLAPFDLLCIRYNGLEMAADESLDERVLALVRMGSSSVCWVGHCVVLKVKHSKRGTVSVHLRLQSSSLEMPSKLLDSSLTSELHCTVEWIPKTTLCRQMEHSVSCLTNASDLAKDIAVGRRPVNNIDQSDVGFLVEKIGQRLNKAQKEGIEAALKQPFTVIQGPPGSGKTLMASHLAWLYVERNRMVPQPTGNDIARTQVLLCASSDTAVDIIAAHLRSLDKLAPRMLRVYDKVVESVDFPVPRDTIPPNKLKTAVAGNPELKGIALHHVIRCPQNVHHKKIQEFDTLFGLYSEDITDDQIEEYRSLVHKAELQELRQAEVILATCSAAASPRMAAGTSIRQIIMDSCESCMEPESLVPLILLSKTQQLVLLGDPRQLQPTVANVTARSLGLSRSLLERYADSAMLLEEQYRMHQAISDLSSLCFYGNKVKVTTRAQQGPAELDVWPGSRAQPVAFCHVSGHEETVTMVTEGGVKESISNLKEAEVVVSIVEGLVMQNEVAEKDVAVICQYTAQQQLIQQQLSYRNITDVAVFSIHQCQGYEFDYVVLSTCRSVSRCEVERRPTDDWLERHLGPTADSHQINVAITRTKKGLVITGNKYLLESHSMWSSLLGHFRKHNSLVEADQFIQALSM